jgi:hypothetical protein
MPSLRAPRPRSHRIIGNCGRSAISPAGFSCAVEATRPCQVVASHRASTSAARGNQAEPLQRNSNCRARRAGSPKPKASLGLPQGRVRRVMRLASIPGRRLGRAPRLRSIKCAARLFDRQAAAARHQIPAPHDRHPSTKNNRTPPQRIGWPPLETNPLRDGVNAQSHTAPLGAR